MICHPVFTARIGNMTYILITIMLSTVTMREYPTRYDCEIAGVRGAAQGKKQWDCAPEKHILLIGEELARQKGVKFIPPKIERLPD